MGNTGFTCCSNLNARHITLKRRPHSDTHFSTSQGLQHHTHQEVPLLGASGPQFPQATSHKTVVNTPAESGKFSPSLHALVRSGPPRWQLAAALRSERSPAWKAKQRNRDKEDKWFTKQLLPFTKSAHLHQNNKKTTKFFNFLCRWSNSHNLSPEQGSRKVRIA